MADYKIPLSGDEISEAIHRGKDLNDLADGQIPVKNGTDIEASALTESSDKITSSKDMQVPPDTIYIGEGTAVSGNIRAISVKSEVTGNTGLVLAQLFDDSGFAKPFAYAGGPPDDVPTNNPEGSEVANTATFQRVTTADELIVGISVKTNQISQAVPISATIRMGDSSGIVAAKISDTVQTGGTGVAFLDLRTNYSPILIDSGEAVNISVDCTGMLGKTKDGVFTPNMIIKRIAVTREDLALKGDIPVGAQVTWSDVVQASEDDTSGRKLDASHIGNLPSGGTMTGAEIIKAIEDDPTDPKLPAADVAYLTGTVYRETDQAILIDPVNKTYIEIQFEHTGAITQTMPNLVNSRDGLRFMVRNSKTDDSIITLVPANRGETIDGLNSYYIDPGTSVLFIAMTWRSSWHVETEFEHDKGPVTAGITLDNVTDDIAGVTKINVPTSTLIAKGDGEVDLIPHITLRNTPPSQQDNLAKEIHLLPPLKTYPDPDAQEVGLIEIDPAAYEPQHAPGYLAQLATNEGVIGRQLGASDEHDGIVWCDVEITPSGEYFDVRRAKKLIGIQDGSDDDPNLGGMPTEVMANVSFVGDAPADGILRCYWMQVQLISGEATYLLDAEGDPIGTERQYKAGDKLRPEPFAGIVEAKGLQYIQLHVMHTFGTNAVLLDHTQTYVCIQQQMNGYKTSVAKLEFEQRTGLHITPRVEYLGPDEAVLSAYLKESRPAQDVPAGQGMDELDQFGVHNLTAVNAGISGGILTIGSASDLSITDFDVHQIEDFETCQMARGHNVKYEIEIQGKNDAWRLDLYAWTGNPNEYTELYNSRNNGSLIVNAGWTQVATTFISEDIVSGIHTASVSGTIPNNANNFGGFLYPVGAQNPITLKLKDFALSYDPAFTGFLESSPRLDAETHLEKSDLYRKFVQNTQGFASLRYTLNNVAAGLPMPCGIAGKGAADITVDNTVNQVPGSQAKGGEGALKFGADGDVLINTSLQLWNETGSDHTATFWWATASSDGNTFTKIADSESSFTARANSDTIGVSVNMKPFRLNVRVGDRIALRGKADATDGAFLECNNNKKPLVETICQFDEIKPALSTDLSTRLTKSELRVIPFAGQTGQNYTFEFVKPAGVEIGAHEVEGVDGTGKLTSEKGSEYSYDPATQEMTIHIGSAQNGKIKIELWG